jgi:hypothetical protein
MSERESNLVPKIQLGAPPNGEYSTEDFDIGAIKIRAFYDSAHRLLFVLDNTRDKILPNVLLAIDGRGDRKWDDILQNDLNIRPEDIRPRVRNKYQKLDIDYSGPDAYADAILNGDAAALTQWRLEAAARQRDFRIGEAEREISLARATIREAEKTIADLDEFTTLQKEKLKAAKKMVGMESPKDSAAKILRYEARIEKAEAKRQRSLRRLRRAEKRIDSSAKMLNNYAIETPNIGEREMNDNEIRPLFTEEPKIMDAENAFKPVSFGGAQSAPDSTIAEDPKTQSAFGGGIPERRDTPAPGAYNAMQPPKMTAPAAPMQRPIPEPAAAFAPERPIAPVSGDINLDRSRQKQGGGAYYLMLMILIGLSIFTLYLYQKKMNAGELPHIAATITEPDSPLAGAVVPAEAAPGKPQDGFAGGGIPAPIVGPEPVQPPLPEPIDEPPFIEPEPPIPEAPAEIAEPEPLPAEPQEFTGIDAEPAIEEEPVVEPVIEYEQQAAAMPDAAAEVETLEYEPNDGEFEQDPMPDDFTEGTEE